MTWYQRSNEAAFRPQIKGQAFVNQVNPYFVQEKKFNGIVYIPQITLAPRGMTACLQIPTLIKLRKTNDNRNNFPILKYLKASHLK